MKDELFAISSESSGCNASVAPAVVPPRADSNPSQTPIQVRPMDVGELDEAFALTRAHPELKTIAADDVVIRVLTHNAYSFWGVYPTESGSPLLAYYGFLLLNTIGAQALIDGRLDPLDPDRAYLASTDERPEAIYIWLVVAPGLSSRATPMVTISLGKICRGVPLYARAGTQAGLNLMRRQGFRAVNPENDGLGGLFIFGGAADSFKMREPRVRPEGSACDVKVARTSEDVERALAIRSAVYLIEQQCPYEEEFDGNDRTATHMLGLVGGEPAATLRLRYFAEFAKIERVSVLPRYRNTPVAKELVRGTLEFLRRKGYRKVYGHVQKRLINYWTRFGFKLLETNHKLVFSDHEYVLMWGELEPHPDALSMHSNPYVLLRPEGKWDEPCLLESSAARPATNPH